MTQQSRHEGRSEAQKTIGMDPDEEQRYLEESGSQGEPADGGVGAMTDDQGRDPDTAN